MDEAIKELQNIGVQKIYEQTHIPTNQLEAIFHEEFAGMHKVQFLGFLSILEREYGVDLQILRLKAIAYFEENAPSQEESAVLQYSKERQRNKKLYLIVVFAAVLVVVATMLYFFFSNKQSNHATKDHFHVKQPQMQEKNTTAVVVDYNQTHQEVIEQNVTVPKKQTQQENIENLNHTLSVTPKKRLWIGYIDLQTKKKYQKIIKESLELNSSKNWLIVLGHGYVTIKSDGDEQEYETANKIRFLYKDNQLKQLTLKEFKQYNQGKAW